LTIRDHGNAARPRTVGGGEEKEMKGGGGGGGTRTQVHISPEILR